MGSFVVGKLLNALQVLIDARIQLENVRLTTLPRFKILDQIIPAPIVEEVSDNNELFLFGSQGLKK